MNKQTVNLLVFLVILTNHEYLCLDIESYSNVILKNFDFKSPITLIGNVQNISKYTKHFSKNGKYVAFQNYDQTVCGVKLLKSNQIAFKDGKAATLVILKKSTFDLVLNEMVCMLNEEVYLLNENTREIHETYTIKNIRIQRMIARISQDLTFVWTENQSIVKRRSNFHGVHLSHTMAITSPKCMLCRWQLSRQGTLVCHTITRLLSASVDRRQGLPLQDCRQCSNIVFEFSVKTTIPRSPVQQVILQPNQWSYRMRRL